MEELSLHSRRTASAFQGTPPFVLASPSSRLTRILLFDVCSGQRALYAVGVGRVPLAPRGLYPPASPLAPFPHPQLLCVRMQNSELREAVRQLREASAAASGAAVLRAAESAAELKHPKPVYRLPGASITLGEAPGAAEPGSPAHSNAAPAAVTASTGEGKSASSMQGTARMLYTWNAIQNAVNAVANTEVPFRIFRMLSLTPRSSPHRLIPKRVWVWVCGCCVCSRTGRCTDGQRRAWLRQWRRRTGARSVPIQVSSAAVADHKPPIRTARQTVRTGSAQTTQKEECATRHRRAAQIGIALLITCVTPFLFEFYYSGVCVLIRRSCPLLPPASPLRRTPPRPKRPARH